MRISTDFLRSGLSNYKFFLWKEGLFLFLMKSKSPMKEKKKPKKNKGKKVSWY